MSEQHGAGASIGGGKLPPEAVQAGQKPAPENSRRRFEIDWIPQIQAVADRMARERLLWRATLLHAVVTALFLAAGYLQFRHPELLMERPVLPVAVVFLFCWLAGRAWRSWRPDPARVAAVVERFDSTLGGRLSTAVEQVGDDSGFHFLQKRLFDEVADRAQTAPWHRSVPAWRLACARLFRSGSVMASLFAALLWVAPQWIPGMHQGVMKTAAEQPGESPLMTAEVQPGDVELEKGTRLSVSARLTQMAPGVQLVYRTRSAQKDGDHSAPPQRMPMREALGEPLYGASVESVETDLEYWVEAPGAPAKRFQVTVFEFPALVQSDARVLFPEGTEPREKLFENARKLTVPEGSDIEWKLHFNKPLKSARLVPKDSKEAESGSAPLDLAVAEQKALWSLPAVSGSLQMRLELEDDRGRHAKEAVEFSVKVIPNQPPKLRPLTPRPDARFTAIEEVDFDAEVWDDGSLKRWGVTVQLGNRPPAETVLGEDGKPGQKIRLHQALALEDLGVQVGEAVTWFFWAEEALGGGSLRRTESDLMLGRVRAFEEEYFQGVEGGAEKGGDGEGNEAVSVMNLQKEVLAATWNLRRTLQQQPKPGSENIKGLGVVEKSEQRVADLANEKLEKEEDYERKGFWSDAVEHAKKAGAELAAAAGDTGRLANALTEERAVYDALAHLVPKAYMMQRGKGKPKAGSEQTRQMSNLEFAKKEDRYESKSEAEKEESAKNKERQEMEDLLAQLRALARRQEEVAERMRELEERIRSSADEREKEAARRELKKLSDEQKLLAQELENAREKAAEKNETLADSKEKLDAARDAAQKAASALERGSVEEAQAAAARASERLREGSNALRQQLSGQTREAARKLQERAQELVEEERKIAADLHSENKRAPAKLGSAAVRQDLDAQRRRLEGFQQDLQKIAEGSEASEPLFSKALQEAHRSTIQNQTDLKLQAASQAVLTNNTTVARRAEKAASADLESLAQAVEKAADEVLGDDSQALRQARAAVDEIANRLAKELGLGQRPDPAAQNAAGSPESVQLAQAGKSNPRGAGSRNPDEKKTDQGAGGKDAQGDQQSAGGKDAQGGQQGAGGKDAQSGQQGAGGKDAQGGQQGAGGKDAQGGQQGVGAKDAQGGQQGAGGKDAQGGQQGAGGKDAQGGPQGAGGKDAQGGPQGAGGKDAQGGPQGAGGKDAQGGQQGAGGKDAQGAGGKDAQGGQQGTGGKDAQGGQQGGSPAEIAESGIRGGADAPHGGNTEGRVGGNVHGGGDGVPAQELGAWISRLDRVETLLERPHLRAGVARAQRAAEQLRSEIKRNATKPNSREIEQNLLQPLIQLRDSISAELARREGRESDVPVDREPVPRKFEQPVKRYYEALGGGR